MRKKTLGITTLIILAMTLAACGSNSPTASGSGSNTSNRGGGFGGGGASRTPNPMTVLAVGTFKLEGTPQAVDATEAAKLIPLWQLMNQLETSSSTAPQEITATVNAIQAAMTPAQIQAIQGMQISQRDVFTVLQESGALPSGFGNFSGQNGSGATRTGNNGNFRGGGGGGLGFLFGGGPGGARPQNGTGATANNGTGAAAGSGVGGFNSALITQLIKLLQAKIQQG